MFCSFFGEQGAFSVKYSFDTEIEINPLSNPYFKTGSICQLRKNLSWDLNYLTASDAENPAAKQHLGKNVGRQKKSIYFVAGKNYSAQKA